MKKLLALFLLLLVLPVLALADEILLSLDQTDYAVYKDFTYRLDLDGSQYTWSSSDRMVVHVFSWGGFAPISSGKATITGIPKDASLKKVKLNITVPDFAYSSDLVEVTTSEGELFEYKWQGGSARINMKATGDVFKYESIPVEDSAHPDLLRILPLKPGKGQLVFEINRHTFKIDVIVHESALVDTTPVPIDADMLIMQAALDVYGDDLLASRAGKYPTISVQASGTADTIRSETNRKALKMLEKIRHLREEYDLEFIDFRFEIYTDLIDEYGNEKSESVLGFNITAEAIDKINFKNMLASNIPKIAINWYEHPVMKK